MAYKMGCFLNTTILNVFVIRFPMHVLFGLDFVFFFFFLEIVHYVLYNHNIKEVKAEG